MLKFRMATDTFFFRVRANAVRALLCAFSSDHPSWRETDIQVAKLERMIVEFHDKFTSSEAALVPQSVSKSLRKRIGAELRAMDQQAKLMHKLLLKTMEEDFFVKYSTGHTHKEIRCLLAWANRVLEQKLYQDTQEVKREVLGVVAASRQLAA